MAQPELKLVEVDYAAEGEANCKALGQIFERIGDKWTIMIVGVLSATALRDSTPCNVPSQGCRIRC